MKKSKVLVSWVADRDFCALFRAPSELTEAERSQLFRQSGADLFILGEKNPLRSLLEKDGLGPVMELLKKEPFEKVVLISERGPRAAVAERYGGWLAKGLVGVEVLVRQVDIAGISDYSSILRETASVLSDARELADELAGDLAIHLTPGTRAMGAVLVLLGKSRFSSQQSPVTFWETYPGRVQQAEIPFDIFLVIEEKLSQQTDLLIAQLERRGVLAGYGSLVGETTGIKKVKVQLHKAAEFSTNCLILGETGTGKEIIANLIHKSGPRKDKPFERVNCAAIAESLLESELFGHKKGAFTNATADSDGLLKQADGGILFLDEVGECSPALQAKLLRVLESGEFRKVGGDKTEKVDVQVVAATGRAIVGSDQEVDFRADLYFRLAQVVVEVPPLRERKKDIPLLVEHLLRHLNEQYAEVSGYKARSLSSSALSLLKKHSWPGNVRELQAVLRQALIFSTGEQAELGSSCFKDVMEGLRWGRPVEKSSCSVGEGFDLQKQLRAHEVGYIKEALLQAGGKKVEAAKLLGITRQNLNARLKRFGLGS